MLKIVRNFFIKTEKIELSPEGDGIFLASNRKYNPDIKLKDGTTTFNLHLVNGMTYEIFSENFLYLEKLVNIIHHACQTETICIKENKTVVIKQIVGNKRLGLEDNDLLIFNKAHLVAVNFPREAQKKSPPATFPVENKTAEKVIPACPDDICLRGTYRYQSTHGPWK